MSQRAAWCWIFLLSFPAHLWAAYAISTLWSWFAVPIGAPHIGVVRAMGLLLVFSVAPVQALLLVAQIACPGSALILFVALAAIIPAICLAFGALYRALLAW